MYKPSANQIIKQLDPDLARLVSKDTMASVDSLLRDPPQIPIDMRLLLSLVGAFGLLGEGGATSAAGRSRLLSIGESLTTRVRTQLIHQVTVAAKVTAAR
jgi:hypothetical protein